MAKRLQELALFTGGRVIGDPDLLISGVCSVDQVGAIHELPLHLITFAESPSYIEMLRSSSAAAAFLSAPVEGLKAAQVIVEDPRRAFFMAAALFQQEETRPAGVSPLAFVDPSARIGKDASILPLAFIGPDAVIGDRTKIFPGVFIGPGVSLGDDCVINANVSIGQGTKIGNRAIIHFGACMGADGFGFIQQGDENVKVPQMGGIRIGDDVEIGANSTIDRATLGDTIIGSGTKIDNLVQVGHNCKIGKNCILVAHAGLAGSTVLGDNVIVAARAGTMDHITIGDKSVIGAMAGVRKDLPPGSKVIGYPAEDHLVWKRNLVHISKLGEMAKRLRDLEKRIAELEKRGGR